MRLQMITIGKTTRHIDRCVSVSVCVCVCLCVGGRTTSHRAIWDGGAK